MTTTGSRLANHIVKAAINRSNMATPFLYTPIQKERKSRSKLEHL